MLLLMECCPPDPAGGQRRLKVWDVLLVVSDVTSVGGNIVSSCNLNLKVSKVLSAAGYDVNDWLGNPTKWFISSSDAEPPVNIWEGLLKRLLDVSDMVVALSDMSRPVGVQAQGH